MPYLLGVAIGAIALILAPGILLSFDVTPKLIVLLVACSLATFPARRSRFLWLMAATFVSLGVSTALSTHPALSFYGSGWRRYGALAQVATLLLAWSVLGQTRHIRLILRIIIFAGAVTALYGISQYLGWDPILPAAAYHIGEGVWTIVRPPSTLGYVSYFATWLVFIVFLSVGVGGWQGKIIAALALVATLTTGTRAAFLGLLAGAVVWCFWRGFRLSRRVLAFTLSAAIAVAGLYVSPLGQPMRSRTRWFQEDPWGGARPLLWRDSLRMGLARPLFGYGPETFTATFPHYESKELARAYPDFAHESPHNIFLDALVSQGAPGLVLLVLWCGMGFAAAWRIRVKQPGLAAGLAGALAAGIVSQQFTVFTIPTGIIFFATVALAEGLQEPEVRPGRYVPFALPLLYFAARMAYTDHALALAQRALTANDLASAASHYNSSGQADDLWYSRVLAVIAGSAPTLPVRIQAFQQAVPAAERATRTSESPFNAWYSLSALRASQNNAMAAEQCLRRAIESHPTWFKPHWTLAQLLDLEGRRDEAVDQAQLAADLDGGKHSEVIGTLQAIKERSQK